MGKLFLLPVFDRHLGY